MTEVTSAADKHDDGWPEPASVVAFSERMRRRLPFSLSVSIDVGICFNFIPLDESGLIHRICGAFNPVAYHADTFDLDFHNFSRLHGLRRSRRPCVNDITGEQCHELTDVTDHDIDGKNKLAGSA